MKSTINRFLAICLDVAEYYDRKGEKENHFITDDEMLKTLGLGYRAFSGYIRNGVSEVITLQGDLHTERERLHFSDSKAELIDRIIPYLDPDLDSKEAIKKIRDIISGEE